MARWDPAESEQIIERILDASSAEATVVRIERFEEGATRYANSEITQNVVRGDTEVEIQAAFGSRTGKASTNRLDPDSLVACLRRAEAIARTAPPDPEYMPPVEPGPCPTPPTASEATSRFSPADRKEAIERAVAVAEREGMSGAGVFTTATCSEAIGNSTGLFVHNETTEVYVTVSATSPDSVGWARGCGNDVASLDIEAIARRAVEKARAGRSPREPEPGHYDVVLEPAAVEELLLFFFWYQMDAKATDEKRTFLQGKKGTAIAAPSVNIFSDPTWKGLPSRPFTDEGMTLGRVEWIKGGVLENLIYSRFWAKKQGVEPTGSPTNLVMEGGASSIEEMIRSTRRGLLVTRFWYVRAVEPIRDLYTGMTRDGTFLIRDGEIAGPVKNMRFNESAVRLLANIEMLGPQEKGGEYLSTLIPAVKARDFNFTSKTAF